MPRKKEINAPGVSVKRKFETATVPGSADQSITAWSFSFLLLSQFTFSMNSLSPMESL
jgi:hypothetical protein